MDVVAWNSLIMACGQEKWQLAPLLLDAMPLDTAIDLLSYE